MLAQRWSNVGKPTIKGERFTIFIQLMLMLVQGLPNVVHQTPTISQRYNGTTVCQRWPNVVMLSGE